MVTILAAGLVSLLLVIHPYLGFAVGILPLVAWLGTASKKNALFLFLLLLPYHATAVFTENFMGITGAKPFNLLAFFLLAMFLFHNGRVFRMEDDVEKKTMWVFGIYLVLFTVAVIRSLDYLHMIYMMAPDKYHSSPVNHILSFLVRPALFSLSFLYVLKHIRTEKEISQTIDVICGAIFILSCIVLVITITNITRITVSRAYLDEIISSFFSMHRNAIGSIYITCIPLLVLRALGGRPFPVINYAAAGAAVLLLQSRSTIAVFLGGTILLLWFARRWKALAFFAGIFLLFFLFWLPDFLARVLSIGLHSGTVDAVLTGRVDNLWVPLLRDRFNNPDHLFFGVGFYSILVSPAYLQHGIFQVNHPHNAFLELFLDCGLIVFSVFVFYLAIFLKKALSLAKKADTPLGWALLTCLITYLAGTISGRSFYPSRNTMYLFPVVALLINYFRLRLSDSKHKEAPVPNGD